MDPARFRRLMDLVGEATELREDQRDAWIAERCAGDPTLLEEARSLLAGMRHGDLEALTDGLRERVAHAAGWVGPWSAGYPSRIGAYEIGEVLGEGGMGVVYGARQEQPLRRDVAIKVLHGGAHAPRIVARFELERRTLASLDHPSIARVFDAGTTPDGRPYFVMEWVRGLPITEYCDARRLDIDGRLSLIQKVLGAVQYAHQKAIIHRDLKPSNILVTEVDGEPIPKVIDFGIARVEPTESDLTTAHTAFGAVLGTIEYMSPEQALAPATGVGTRSDVYSLGVVLYELLTGLLPFPAATLRAASPVEIERLLRHTEPPAPSRRLILESDGAGARAEARATEPARLHRSLRGDLDNIVAMAMRKDPARRYASVLHFSDDIGRFLQARPVEARRATWAYRARRFVWRNRWAVGAAAIVITTGSTMAGAFTYRLAAERDRARLEAAKAAQVATFLQELFRVADPSATSDRDVTARELLDQGAERIASELASQPALQASLLGVVGNTYRGLGLWAESERRLEEALELERALLGDEHPDVATRLHELGVTRTERGDFEAADEALRGALALRRRLLGENDAAVGTTLSALAMTLRARGDLAGAEEAAAEAVRIHRETLGPDHLETALSLHNLAFVLRLRGRLEDAEGMYREALAVRRRLLDPSHPDLVVSLANLAVLLEVRGAYAEAEASFREALELRRARLGEEHPLTLTSLNNLAYMLWRIGSYARADTVFAEAVAVGRRAFPGDHPTVAIMLNNLGVARRRAGDLAHAESLHREALAMNRRLLGTENPRVAGDMDNLGRVLLLAGDARAAEQLHREALAMRTRLLGAEHPDRAESLSGLADARLALGEAAEAQALMREALDVRSIALGADNPRVAATAHDLGVLLAAVGELDEAERLLNGALATRRASLPEDHPDVAATLRELGRLLARTGRLEEARSALVESRRILVTRLGDSDPDTQKTDSALAALRRLDGSRGRSSP